MTLTARKSKKDQNSQFRALLEQKRDELVRRLHERRAELRGQQDTDDEVAVAVQCIVKELALTNIEREIRTLAEVELSLRKLDEGEYGICGSCGEKIPEARLRALPWTRLCVDCAGGGINRSQVRDREEPTNSFPKPTPRLHIVPKRKTAS